MNNAGIAPPPSLLHETSEEVWDQVMAVNARSVFLGSKYAITQMLKQEPHQSGDRGWIINIASVAGLVGCAGTRKAKMTIYTESYDGADCTINPAPYSASTGAIVQTTKQVAIDYAKHRIHCNVICPGC